VVKSEGANIFVRFSVQRHFTDDCRMTESQTLLAEYAETGSEAAFRELVTRYIGLVYSTGLRLVGGDTHLAEDVAQTVFADLASTARSLSKEVLLGGWLHRRTFYVASPLMRAQRRRQAREREAAYMSTLQDEPGSKADLLQIAPMLDEAITRLGSEDRTAIILRFFERRGFRSIGEALGSNEDAARMRVNRALDKLHALLMHRGATLSATALGVALASESLTAAPVGLVTSIAASALAASTTGGGIYATVLKLMAMTKVQTTIVGAIAAASVATSLLLQHDAQAKLQARNEALQKQSGQLADLETENQRLLGLAPNANNPTAQPADLEKLRGEAAFLRSQTNDLASLREQNRQLRKPRMLQPKTPLQEKELHMAKVEFEKRWMLAFRMYADDHGDLFPTNFEQAATFLPPGIKAADRVDPGAFEVVKYDSPPSVTNPDAIVLREKEPTPTPNGKLMRIYGMADGSVQAIAIPQSHTDSTGRQISYDTFEAWEQAHMVSAAK
jgi:RNA polymerase sigma factor (sigma-70 family)